MKKSLLLIALCTFTAGLFATGALFGSVALLAAISLVGMITRNAKLWSLIW